MVKAKVMKKKPKWTGRHQRKWETLKGDYAGWIAACEDGPEYSFCVPCRRAVKVAASGFYDLKSHFKTDGHKANVLKSKQFKPMEDHFTPEASTSSRSHTTTAEVLFCHFLAEHNIAPTAADHFTDLVKEMFPDSKIVKVDIFFQIQHKHTLH